MPNISKRGEQMPASPIRKLVPFAEQAKAEGKKIYHLNIGQPDIKTPTEMLYAIKNIEASVLEYSHSAGNQSYRNALPAYYQQHHISIQPHQIIVTTGGSEAIQFALLACLDAGDELIVFEPYYANYNGFATAAGIVIKPIPCTIHHNFALPPIAQLEAHITPRTKAILICNPNNPTGYVYSAAELETLRQLVLKYNLFFIADEVYREFAYNNTQAISILTLQGIENNAIVVDSVSKRYSACGVRIGALITKNEQVLSAALKFAQARLSPPLIGQIAAEAALKVPQSYFDEVLAEYQHRRDVLVQGLQKIKNVICPTPQGAFYVTAQLPIHNSDHFCQWLLQHFSYQNQTVMLAPATGFYSDPQLGKKEVRMAYVLNTQDLQNALICLEKALEVYPNPA